MHRPRKRFGQNFLKDQNVLNRIIDAAQLTSGDRVFEIGPGRGALTDRLLQAGPPLTVVEVDRELAATLRQRGAAGLEVIEGDVLRLDWSELLPTPPYKLVANLPYNISSQVLFKVIEHRRSFSRLVLMFQKEVGERLLAAPATRDYGILSVLLQTWFRIDRIAKVPPAAFFPPPKVDSVVLCLAPLPTPRAVIQDEECFRRVVKGAFAQRRKTLRNSLIGSGLASGRVDAALLAAGIDPGRRGEMLTIEEFAALAGCYVNSVDGVDEL
jgi:16S rRNA (adenine1518-N6/adenine1519-N6)-dimethyltransferase